MKSRILTIVLLSLVVLALTVGLAGAQNALDKIDTGIKDLTTKLTTIAASIVGLFGVFHGIEFLRSESPDAKEQALKTLAKYAIAAVFIYASSSIFTLFKELFT